jgi:hypothetical protein
MQQALRGGLVNDIVAGGHVSAGNIYLSAIAARTKGAACTAKHALRTI